MGRLGRDPEFFRYVEGSVAARILERTRYALTTLAPAENPYIEYILTGNFERRLPRFLRPEPFQAIKQRLDHLTLFRGTIEEAARVHVGDGFDCFNLSDVFEYLSPDVCRGIHATLLDTARPGARFAYWNMLTPRSCSQDLRHRIRSLEEESRRLFARDKAFFYSALVLEQVV
jgi:S-adenosylmethionine-diacylglycerol 3-amino-3-carboxypropyl transferase